MYIEYEKGSKHAGKHPEKSEFIDTFEDCGMSLTNEDIVVDIDHLPKESIQALIKEFNIDTEVVWTDRGAHLWFQKPANFSRRRDGVCRLGFEIEQHTKSSRPDGMTIKRNGVERKRDNIGKRQPMPSIFTVSGKKNGFQDLTGLEDGDGRNKALFYHRKLLNNCTGWEKILRFINYHVFATPMPDEEFNDVARDMEITGEVDDKYFLATEIMRECKTVVYSDIIWWFQNGSYVPNEEKNLIRYVYDKCEGQPTRYVDEIVKQIEYRSPHYSDKDGFPIQLRNGAITEGQFVAIKDCGFTPYYINVDYKPDAKPVQIVDDYIDSLTSGDPDYRDLLMEVMGFAMITDPERIRALGKFFMFRGDGSNGKGTLLQIMKKIYNAENCTSLSIKQLVDDRYKVTMIGKLANLGDDIEAEAINNDQMKILKNISTADTVATRHMYSESESATFTTKLYFTTNSDIRSFEKGYAYKRRVVWLPMFNKIEKVDPQFITKITTKDALEYWIKMIVEGYKRLYHNGRWTDCKMVDEYNNQYHEKNNVCMQFAKDIDPDTEIIGRTINEIKMDFEEWCSDDSKFSSKLFKEAVWNLYQIGIGKSKQAGKSRRVFMRQSETNQDVKP